MSVSVLSALALTACGSSGNSSTVPSIAGAGQSRQGAPAGGLAAWRAAVACARRHGMPSIPDPVLDSSGHPSIPGGTPTPTPAVLAACGTLFRAIDASTSVNPIESASDIHALLRVAVCFRAHGLPAWPDPNNRGEFHVKSATIPSKETYNRAVGACGSLAPPSGWHITVTPSGQ